MKEFWTKSAVEVINDLNTTKNGLNNTEANKRLACHGENKLGQAKRQPLILKFLAQFKDLMIIILLIASIISLVIGIKEGQSSEIIDGSIILGIVILNSILGFVQEFKAEKAMDALRKMTEPEATVMRNGQTIKINTNKLVVGDIVILEAGVIVPADMRLIESASLQCDESSLTGESIASKKDCNLICKENTPLADRKNMVYSGSTVVSGRGVGVVTSTGSKTEIGKIAHIIESTKKDDTPLQKSLKAVGKIITIVCLVIALVIFIIEIFARPNEPLIDAFLTAVAISVAAIPESMPAVITIIMSLGVARLAKQRAIIKRLHAVETLGSCEIICSDKTGTITQNVMTVKALYYNDKLDFSLDKKTNSELNILLRSCLLCNDSKRNKTKYVGDPTETALCDLGITYNLKKEILEDKYKRVSEIPFDSNRKLMSTINKIDNKIIASVKGAVDMLLDKCSYVLVNGVRNKMTTDAKNRILQANTQMAGKALRILGVAIKELDERCIANYEESELTFVGLVGMIDPPRKEVIEAVKKCKHAGMRPIMITGDHKHTAYAIAKEVGICASESQVITGMELDKLSDEEFLKKINDYSVYARVSPENKVRIVKTFKSLGKVVAMTGDGVNDAPSMKMASIGVGMGITGTDVTKEVADMIVTDDNFASIVIAVEEGRKIYDNIQKTVKFLFSANMGEILALFFATLIFPQFVFLAPVQILFVNLITDSFPAIALGLEPKEDNIMDEKPRDNKKNLFSDGTWLQILLLGALQTIIIVCCYAYGLNKYSGGEAMAMAFYSLNLIQMFYIFSIRTKGSVFKTNPFKNKWLVGAVLFSVSLLILIATTPLHTILGLANLGLVEWLIVIFTSLLMLPFNELYKFCYNKYKKRSTKIKL